MTDKKDRYFKFMKFIEEHPFVCASLLSAVYVGFIVWFSSMTKGCDSIENFQTSYYFERNFVERWMYCRTFNELGDFLAGAFAPLAFFWLVVAVYIQSRELKEQKNELEYTRKEYELMRTEVTASVEQLTAQTKIMLEENRRKSEKEAAEYIDTLVAELNASISINKLTFRYVSLNDGSNSTPLDSPHNQYEFVYSLPIAAGTYFMKIENTVISQAKACKSKQTDTVEIQLQYDADLTRSADICEILDEILVQLLRTTNSQRRKLHYVNWMQFKNIADENHAFIKTLPRTV